jgi:ATP-binding cassette subfamily F protein uup
LDIVTLSVLEDFLASFQGCLLVVTHDRYFMDKMVDHLFVFEGQGVLVDFPGNYTEYRAKKEYEDKMLSKEGKAAQQQPILEQPFKVTPEKPAFAPVAEDVAIAPKKKLSFKEKFEYQELEKEIEKLETEKAELTEKLNAGGAANHNDIKSWTERIGIIIQMLDEKSLRWLELSEGI